MNQAEAFLTNELSKLNIRLSSPTIAKLVAYVKLLLQANESINLTAITKFDEALIKHIYDSLIILNHPEYQKTQFILDIGSGGGIPCFPLAISSPAKKFISLDATQKKIKFQEQTCRALQITNITPLWARAEDYITNSGQRETFDLVIARAVAPINVLAELTLPYVKLNGYALFYKGKDYQKELQEGEKVILTMGGMITNIIQVELPFNFGARSLVYIQKNRNSPKEYPRKAGIPQKKPL